MHFGKGNVTFQAISMQNRTFFPISWERRTDPQKHVSGKNFVQNGAARGKHHVNIRPEKANPKTSDPLPPIRRRRYIFYHQVAKIAKLNLENGPRLGGGASDPRLEYEIHTRISYSSMNFILEYEFHTRVWISYSSIKFLYSTLEHENFQCPRLTNQRKT